MAADAGTSAQPVTAPATTPDSSGQGTSAFERLSRYIARFVSAGAAAYLILLAPSILGQAELLWPWFTPVFVVAIFGPALYLWFASFRQSIAVVRSIVTVMALAYLAAQLLWIPAYVGPKIPGADSTWISIFPGLMSLATALAWRARYIVPYLLVVASFGQVVNYVTRDGHGHVPLFSDIVFGIMFCGIFTLTVALVVRTGRVLDATLVVAESQAASAAASAARSVERERFDALIHDDVMSTLLAASRTGNSELLTRQSAAALARLDRLRSGISSTQPLAPTNAVAYVRGALTRVDENVRIDATIDVTADPEIPIDAVRALSASAAEALRNSLRHAGSDHAVDRRVAVTIDDAGVRIDVRDNGQGFDPKAVAPQRLGLAVSIHGRMRQLPGGTSRVYSVPGQGTTITVTWSATTPAQTRPTEVSA